MLSKILPLLLFFFSIGGFLFVLPEKASADITGPGGKYINMDCQGTNPSNYSTCGKGCTASATSGSCSGTKVKKYYCNGYGQNRQCGNPPTGTTPYAESPASGSFSTSESLNYPGCDQTVQIDVWDSNNVLQDYIVLYTGSCIGGSGACVMRFQQPIGQNGTINLGGNVSNDAWRDPYDDNGQHGGVNAGQKIRSGALQISNGAFVSGSANMTLKCISGACGSTSYTGLNNDGNGNTSIPTNTLTAGIWKLTASGSTTPNCTGASSSLVVYGPPSCSASVNPTTNVTNQSLTWTAHPDGGTGNYTYLWSNAVSGSTKDVTNSYPTAGNRTGTVQVTSSGQNTSCSAIARIVSGTISPSPNPCTINSGTTCNSTITWSALNTINTYVFERRSGSAACTGILFGNVASSSQARPVDTTGYVYDLCTDGSQGMLLIASTPTVYGVYPPFDYSLANSGSLTVPQDTSGNVTVSATLIQGQTQTVTLDGGSGWPANLGLSYNPASRQCTPTAASCTQITITPNASTPIGSNTITVTGSPLNKTTQFVLNVTAPISPWIRTTGGDVHSNSGISTTTGQ